MFNGPYVSIMSCLAPPYQREYSVVTVANPREQTGTITLSNSAGGTIVAEFTLRQASPGTTEISYRHIHGRPETPSPVGQEARQRAERCAKSS